MNRRTALLVALLAALPAAAWAAPYPTRPVEIVVPYGAGGSTDLVARTLAQQNGLCLIVECMCRGNLPDSPGPR